MTTGNQKIEVRANSASNKKNTTSTKERFFKERLFGSLALKSKKITKEKLRVGLIFQRELKKRGIRKKIGEILVDKSYLDANQVAEILKKQNALDLIRKREFGAARQKKRVPDSLGHLVRRFKAGEVIFRENDDSSHDLFVIQSGEIGVYKNSIHLGKRFDKGAFLGTTSCLLKTPRVATAVAMTDAVLLKIPEDDVQAFFAKNPLMALKLSSVLAQRVSKLTQKYVAVVKNLPDSQEMLHDSLLIDSAEDCSVEADNSEERVFAEPLVAARETAAEKAVIKKTSAVIADSSQVETAENTHMEAVLTADKSAGSNDREDRTHTEDSAETLVAGNAGEAIDDAAAHTSSGILDFFMGVKKNEMPAEEEEEDVGEESGNAAAQNISSAEETQKVDPVAAVMRTPERAIKLPQGTLKEIIHNEKAIVFSPEIRRWLDCRLEMYVKLEDVAVRRDALDAKESSTDKAKNELASLRRELSKFPPYDSLKMKRDKLATMIQPSDKALKEAAPALPALTPDVVDAYKISVEQKSLLLGWYDGIPEMIKACSDAAAGQFMYKVLQKAGVNPDNVFGWAVYVMALEDYAEELKENQKELKAALKEILDEEEAKKGGGLFGIFKKKPEIDENELEVREQKKAELESAELICRLKIAGVNKELAQVEAIMVDEFWAVYGALGLLLVRGVDRECEKYVRAYLRWGVLGFAGDFIKPDILEKLLAECEGGAKLADFGMEENYIIYADEVIELTARKKLLPSPNEDLEMNERNSPRWKLDRAHRRVVGGEFYLGILKDLQVGLEKAAQEKRDEREAKEKEMNDVPEDDPDYKKKTKMLKKTVQALKVAAVKSEKLVEKVRDEMAVKVQADIDAGKEAMEELGMQPEAEDLARHEITCIRRFSRLVAKLQEPFLPFTLKNRFDPEMKTTNTRDDMLAVLKEVEEKDPLIFKENMLSSMKKNNRVQIRSAPFIHLLPASGIMGFLVAPRTDTYSGKLMLPGYFERSGMREAIAVDTFSDFRYDTSKEQAGNDVMNSDTLVAAYAEVRWIMRKKEKDVRQRAGIFTDENERTNWRRHYAMYINSAADGGKQLFFKCPDLYELIINKFIELPEGVDVLVRG